jgi:hypothetical protein
MRGTLAVITSRTQLCRRYSNQGVCQQRAASRTSGLFRSDRFQIALPNYYNLPAEAGHRFVVLLDHHNRLAREKNRQTSKSDWLSGAKRGGAHI